MLTESSNVHSWNIDSKVLAASSGREFEKSRHSTFLKGLGISENRFCRPKQVHGREIVIVDSLPAVALEADGIVTQKPGIAIGILTADCIPAFFYDSKKQVIGLAHAGWRGLHQGILTQMVQLFQGHFGSDPKSIKIVLGPFIRKCCYEVGGEFRDYFPEFYQSACAEKGFMDLTAAAVAGLLKAGIPADQIVDSGICTVCRNDLFFSARKEKTVERILSVMQIG